MTALIVEGEPRIRHQVRDQLRDRGIRVTAAGNMAEATAAIATRAFHVVILDLALPDGSGLDVLKVLRDAGSTAHVIILSDSPAELDRVEAMQAGADDFVVKPFFLRELTARVLAVRRRRDPEHDHVLPVGRCEMNLRSREVICAGEVVDLTAKEFDLLAYLAVRPGYVFSREQLLNAVWHSASEWQQSATVTEHVRRLRNKIEVDPAHPVILTTVRGAGYRLDLPRTGDATDATQRRPVELGVIVHVDGRIVFADEAADDLLAVPDGATLVGRHVLELAAPSSQAAATTRLADGVAGRARRSEILQLLRLDGQEVHVEVETIADDWHGKPARRAQLTGLRDAPARLRHMVTGVLAEVADAVIITDLHFHIRSWNSAAERIYGWPEDAVLGRHILDILQPPDVAGQLTEAAVHLERTGRWNGTLVQATRDGSTVRILGSTTLLRDERGEPLGVVSVNRPAEVAGGRGKPEPDSALMGRIEHGIANDEFVVHYQPVVDIACGTLLMLEAMVRWKHPTRGILGPPEFLEAAERSGSIVQLGELVLEKASQQAAEWRRGGADVLLSVNMSTTQLASPGLADRVHDILRRSSFDPAHLWLEVTETALVEELDNASEVLRTLTGLGVGVSIDDFGTGWASLTYLQNFPVHALKIDGSFVAGMASNGTSTAIVRSILSLGADLGLLVVGEGVESKQQHDTLSAMGCTLGQGYFYGRPTAGADVPIDRAARLPAVVDGERLAPRNAAVRAVPSGMEPAAGALARDTRPPRPSQRFVRDNKTRRAAAVVSPDASAAQPIA